MVTIKIVQVAQHFVRQSVPKLIAGVESVIEKMSNNENFALPNPPLATVVTQKNELVDALAIAKDGSKADKATMKVKQRALKLTMRTLGSYVQTIANMNAKTAYEVVISSGMSVQRFNPRKKRVFTAVNTLVSGVVKVFTGLVDKGIMFDFEYTQTPEVESSYVSAGIRKRATRIIAGLESGKTYYFRWRVYFAKSKSDWSDPISLVVM